MGTGVGVGDVQVVGHVAGGSSALWRCCGGSCMECKL